MIGGPSGKRVPGRARAILSVASVTLAAVAAAAGSIASGHGSVVAATKDTVALPPSPPTSPRVPPFTSSVTWSALGNGLGIDPEAVSCAGTTLCVFFGPTTYDTGQFQPALVASSGPFAAGRTIHGHLVTFPVPADGADTPWGVSCPSTSMCLASSPSGIWGTATPRTGGWRREVDPPAGDAPGALACPTVSFCIDLAGPAVYSSTAPLAGAGAWRRWPMTPDPDDAMAEIACPSSEFCVAGGSSGFVGGAIEVDENPENDPTDWVGGPVTTPAVAQHSWEYTIDALSCPTVRLCVADEEAGPQLVSTDPAAGASTWEPVTASSSPASEGSGQAIASCTPAGSCTITDAGTFATVAGAAGPQVAGFPLTSVSCISPEFCVSVAGNRGIRVGGVG